MMSHDTPGCDCETCVQDREVHRIAVHILKHLQGKGISQGYMLAACIRLVAFITMIGEMKGGTRADGIAAVGILLNDELRAYAIASELELNAAVLN